MTEPLNEVFQEKVVIFENKEMGAQYTSLHHIDNESGVISKVDVDSKSQYLSEYIEHLMKDIQDKPTKRVFKFRSGGTTEIRAAIGNFVLRDYSAVDTNAKRLLAVEQKTNEKIKNLKANVQKGSLFQTVINVDDNYKMVIIAKAEHNDFLDAQDFILHMGLPWKKKVFKSFLAAIDNTGKIIKVIVADTNTKISEYWWSDFFELDEVRTDRFNTKLYLEALDKKILDLIKKKFPADHTILRSSAIGHFRSQDDLDHLEFYNAIFKNYPPVDEKFPIDKIRKSVLSLPEDYGVDSQFRIEKDEVKGRISSKIPLFEGVELVYNGGADLDNIEAGKNKEGDKYILIKTEEGYNRFKK